MNQLEIKKIRTDFYSIEFGAVRCFMFISVDKVLLVDTGFPDRGLIDKIREVTDLPIQVIYSHCDGDHTGDIEKFDDVLLHPAEMDYLNTKHPGDFKLKPLWECENIVIGDYDFQVVLIPGHTPGSIGLLEKKQRFMLTGDTVHFGPVHMFGPGRNLQAYLESLYRLKTLSNDVDVFYACHHDLEVPVNVLDELIDGVKKVIDHSLEGEPVVMKGMSIHKYTYKSISLYAD